MSKKTWTTGELITKAELDKLLQDLKDEPLYASIVKKTATYTALLTDTIIITDTSGGAFTITLPKATGSGKVFVFKQVGTGTNALTIDGDGSETIDGATTHTAMDAQYDTITIVDSETGKWSIISSVLA